MTTPILPPLEEPFQKRSRLAESQTPEQVHADRLAIITAPTRMDPDSSRYNDGFGDLS